MRPEAIIIAFIIFAGAAWGGLRLLSHGFDFYSIAESIMFVSPLFITVVAVAAPIWVGLGLGSLAFSFSLPIALFQRFDGSTLVCMVLAGAVTLQSAFRRGHKIIFSSTESALMFAVAISVLGRFAYDRPGSGRLGDVGGLGEAFAIVMGVISYFVMARIASDDWRTRQNLLVVGTMAVFGAAVNQALTFRDSIWTWVFALFSRQMWLICSLLLAVSLSRHTLASVRKLPIATYLVIILTLFLSVISPHRSRPLFACAIILSVSWVYGYVHKWVFAVGSIAAALLLYMAVAGSSSLPLLFSRSLSTVFPVAEGRIEHYSRTFSSSPESGWKSPFRTKLYALAWEQIQRHPFLGKGFIISRDDMLWAFSQRNGLDKVVAGLAVSGCYHNTIVELAVFCGVPTAMLFFVVWGLGITTAFRVIPGIEDRHLKILSAGVLGFLLATSGQMLLNGAACDLFYVCIMLGTLRGICIRLEQKDLAAKRQVDSVSIS